VTPTSTAATLPAATFDLPRLGAGALLLAGSALAVAVTAAGPAPARHLWILLAVTAAALVSSTAGFAFSAIAGSAVYHLAGSPVEAVTTLMACSIAIQGYAVTSLWRTIDWRRLAPFLAGGLVTVGPACWVVLHAPTGLFLRGLGLLLVGYGAFMALRRTSIVTVGRRTGLALDLLAGALGGVTGPLAAFPSAAVVAWCSARGWSKEQQRAVQQPFILIMQLVTMAILATLGGREVHVGAGAWYALPALAGCAAGLALFRRMTTAQFQKLVFVLLFVSGAVLAVK
jgi:uncharacterized membrane protein YfcA